MAAIPQRAQNVEAALVGARWDAKGIAPALKAFDAQTAGAATIMPVPSENWVALSQAALPPVFAGRFTVAGSHDRDRVPDGIEFLWNTDPTEADTKDDADFDGDVDADGDMGQGELEDGAGDLRVEAGGLLDELSRAFARFSCPKATLP